MTHFEFERSTFVNDGVTLETDVLSDRCCFFSGIALVAQGAAGVFDETQVSERHMTDFTREAERMPVVVHRFDDSSDDEFTAFSAAGCIQDVKVMLTVLPALELVEDGILSKGLKALGTHETALVPDLTACTSEHGR